MRLSGLIKPEYLFRPRQIWRRMRVAALTRGAFADPMLPWGHRIHVRTDDFIGYDILKLGVYDLPVAEVLLRLLEPGETAVDAGANIGQMTAAMAAAVGAKGTVWSFEPHPEVFRELSANVASWRAAPAAARFEPRELALSDQAGVARLLLPRSFSEPGEVHAGRLLLNRGTPSIAADAGGGAAAVEVRKARLDAVVAADVGLVKIDVEGHEREVLAGASGLLEARRIRDVVFEDYAAFPSPTASVLRERGFTLFRIFKTLGGVVLQPTDGTRPPTHRWEPPNYLATLAPERAAKRMAPRGWRALRG